jgi:hypothetical protein
MHLIIVNPNLHRELQCGTVGEFIWSDKHRQYIWQGRELEVQEYKEKIQHVVLESQRVTNWPAACYGLPVLDASEVDAETWKRRAHECRADAERAEANAAVLAQELAAIRGQQSKDGKMTTNDSLKKARAAKKAKEDARKLEQAVLV